MQKSATTVSIVDSLQRAVANSYTVFMNYKRYHWNTFGPLFRDIHLLFDEHADAILKGIDEFGERVRILSAESIGSPEEVSRLATAKMAYPNMTVRAMIEQAITNHKLVISEFKDAIKTSDANNDPGTSDLFIRIIQVHEKELWFLSQFLARNDGLVAT